MGKFKVVLDPGHGQYVNPYPAAPGYYEGTQMFKLGVVLKAKLEASGIDVIITRQTIAENPELATRGRMAGANKADLFISLHSDAIGSYVSTTAKGVSVFYSITDSANNKKFAANLSSSVSRLMNTRDRGALTRIGNGNADYYGVIRNSAASGCKAAFLIEHGFHTNPSDVKMLIDDSFLSKIADVECGVICEWFGIKSNASSVSNKDIAVVPGSSISGSEEEYTVYKEIPKYTNAANAMSGDTSLSCGKLTPGVYFVYKKYNGSYNLTKTVGTPGAWINPNDNSKVDEIPDTPIKPNTVETSEKYEVYKTIKKYGNAADANTMTNNVGTAEPGVYYIFTTSNGMYNISKTKNTPGFWMNPEQNLFTTFNGIDVGDTVIFTTGFTPKYGANGGIIPVSVIAQVCAGKCTKVKDRRILNNEREVQLDTINTWVPIKYLTVIKEAEANDSYNKTVGEKEETDKNRKLTELLESLKDPKYDGIIESIKSGALNDFLTTIVSNIFEDDSVIDGETDFEFIMGKSIATKTDMVDFVKQHNPDFDPDIAEAFLTKCKPYKIRGDVAFCQSIIETGWFKFADGTAVKPEQHNYCGMGVTSLGVTGNSFSSIEVGVEAQMQHLYAYATKDILPSGVYLYDPRFNYVDRGSAPRWVDLEGKWCAQGSDYGKKILDLWKSMVTKK